MVPNYSERSSMVANGLKSVILVALGACLLVSIHTNSPCAQEFSSPDTACIVCHDPSATIGKSLDQVPPHVLKVHQPFDERKCYQCHQFRFTFKAAVDHSFTFQTLAFDRTFSFRLNRFELGNSPHLSSVYSFSPKDIDIRGALMQFSASDGFEQIELAAQSKDPSSAILTWKTSVPEYCMVEWGEQLSINDQLEQARSFHAENSILSEEIGIKACYQCHPKKKLGLSHPVNILPSQKVKEKMKTAHLPTGKNGLLLCITCHFPHASSEGCLGRKAVTEELCLACHPKEIYNPK